MNEDLEPMRGVGQTIIPKGNALQQPRPEVPEPIYTWATEQRGLAGAESGELHQPTTDEGAVHALVRVNETLGKVVGLLVELQARVSALEEGAGRPAGPYAALEEV